MYTLTTSDALHGIFENSEHGSDPLASRRTEAAENSMPSYYDDKKKCRVGEMDESQFYRESESVNAAYFKKLIVAWTKAGGLLKWGAGGVGLRGPIDSKETGVCFLAPQFAGKQDRIELACTALVKQIGARFERPRASRPSARR